MAKHRSLVIAIIGIFVLAISLGTIYNNSTPEAQAGTQITNANSAGSAFRAGYQQCYAVWDEYISEHGCGYGQTPTVSSADCQFYWKGLYSCLSAFKK